MSEFDVAAEVKYLLECYHYTKIDKEKFLKRIQELHDSGLISDGAFTVVSTLVKDD